MYLNPKKMKPKNLEQNGTLKIKNGILILIKKIKFK